MGRGYITKNELHSSLLDLINNSGGKFEILKNSVELVAQTNTVDIGINEFNKNTDTLMVFKNSIYLEEGISYMLTDDSRSIVSLEEGWKLNNNKVEFNFIVFKNVPSVDNLDFYTKNEIDSKLIASNENCIYVDALKSDNNSGNSPENAVKTMKKAFSILRKLGSKASFGIWRIKIKGYGDLHTYNGYKSEYLPYIQKLIIEGDVDDNGLPFTIFEKNDNQHIGLWVEPGMRYLRVENIKFRGFRNGFNGYAILMKNQGQISIYNCIAENCDSGFAGINNVTITTNRCIAENCTTGYRAQYSSNATFGSGYNGALYDDNGNGCKAIHCTNGVFVTRNAIAHIDYMNIEDCEYAGVLVEMSSRVHVIGTHFKRNDFGVRVEGGAEWLNNTDEINHFYMNDEINKNRVVYGHFGSGRETRMHSQNATNEYRRSIKNNIVEKTGDTRERIYSGSDIGYIPAYWFVEPTKRIRFVIRGKNEGSAIKILSIYTALRDSTKNSTLASCNIAKEGDFEIEFQIHPKDQNTQLQITKLINSYNHPVLTSIDRKNDMTEGRFLFLTAEMKSSNIDDKLTIYNMETYFMG